MLEPKDLPLQVHEFHHEELHSGGLEKELEAWKKHLEIGYYQKAVTKTISFGVCTHCGDCEAGPGSPQYNLQNLSPTIETFTQMNIWKKMDHIIQSYATYICLIVICIETIRFLLFLLFICQTLIRDGIMGVKAVIYLLCCATKQHSDQVNRCHQRIKRKYVGYTNHSSEDIGMVKHSKKVDVVGHPLDTNEPMDIDDTEDTAVEAI